MTLEERLNLMRASMSEETITQARNRTIEIRAEIPLMGSELEILTSFPDGEVSIQNFTELAVQH
ncbi:MAG: hypothetical protein Q7T64_14375 [Lacisediminimonas sp.]|nr:hypothetical protein [Lacisediminimonas sp.]